MSDELEVLEAEEHDNRMRGPLPRRKLRIGVLVLLWVLRVYVLIAVPLVVYAFIRALHGRL